MNRVGHYFLELRRDTLPWIFILFFVSVIVVTGFIVIKPSLEPSMTLRLGDGIFTTTIIDINQKQATDPIDATVLLPNQAMMARYSYEQMTPVTIRASSGAVDLVWVDDNKRVVHIVKGISSATLDQFTPSSPARYVIELSAGTVKTKTITVGSKADFEEQRVGGF